jgi:hypothetical protein
MRGWKWLRQLGRKWRILLMDLPAEPVARRSSGGFRQIEAILNRTFEENMRALPGLLAEERAQEENMMERRTRGLAPRKRRV